MIVFLQAFRRSVCLLFPVAAVMTLALPSQTAQAAASGTVMVTVRYKGAAEPGRPVFVDGTLRGKTNASGKLRLSVKPGAHVVSALYPDYAGGAATVNVVKDKTTNLPLTLTDEGLVSVFPGKLAPDPLNITTATKKITLEFILKSGGKKPIKGLHFVRLQQDVTGVDTDISERFKVTNGKVVTVPGADLSDILPVEGTQTLSFYLDLGQGASSEVNVPFRVARNRLTGQLQAPPSTPSLPVAKVVVRLTQLDTGRLFKRTSNAAGAFNFGLLPAGNYSVEASRQKNGKTFTSIGTFGLSGNSHAKLTLLGLADWKNNVPPVEVSPAVPKAAQSRSEGRTAAPSFRALTRIAADKAITPVEVTAASAAVNVGVSADGTVTLPKGTKTINLEYEVTSAEYPTYVTQQSVYNDQWSIVLLSSTGSVLFSKAQSVNNQLKQEPVWKADGTTGPIAETFNVAALTANGPAKLTVIVTAKNIGDGSLPTSVRARLPGNALTLEIVSADGHPATMTNPGGTNGGVAVTNLAGYFSFPRPTRTNTFEKGFRVKLTSPSGIKFQDVKQVRIFGLFGTTEYRIYSGAPIAVPNQKDVFFIPATFGHANTANSNVVSVPPPTLMVKFRIEADATVKSKNLTGDVESKELYALYKMPDGFTRYSTRDDDTLGSDDWASRGTISG